MLTEKDYCDYETCVALEELGFNSTNNEYFQSKIISKEIPLKFFDTTLQGTSLEYAPIISLYEAQKWLRKEKEIEVVVLSCGLIGKPYCYNIYRENYIHVDDKQYEQYESAFLEGIKETVKLLKEEK